MLLSLTLAFSALTAGLSMAMGAPRLGILITLLGYFWPALRHHQVPRSGLGIVFVFALTGFMGFTLGPIISSLPRPQWRLDRDAGDGRHRGDLPSACRPTR